MRVADPGRARFRFATSFVVSLAAATLVGWVVATWTDQFRFEMVGPDGQTIEFVNHASAMLLAAILALVMLVIPLPAVRKVRGVVLAAFPVMFFLGTLLGMALATTTFTSIAGLCLFATVLVLAQRWPSAVLMAMPLFFGTFMAVFVGLQLAQIGWIALVLATSGAVVVVLQVLLCPNEGRTVAQVFAGFDKGSDRLLGRLAVLLDESPRHEARRRRVAGSGSRLEMLALTSDAQLSSPLHGLSPDVVDRVHVRIFDREAALSSVASATLEYDRVREGAGAPAGVAEALHLLEVDDISGGQEAARFAISTAGERVGADPDSQIARAEYHLAVAVGHLAVGWHDTRQVAEEVADAERVYEPSVVLGPTGLLPGTEGPALRAQADHRSFLGFSAPIYQRAVRMLIATSTAAAVGYWISPDRWYWAMFGAFSVMMSANGTTEHVRIGVERAIGTALGAAVGILIVDTFSGHIAWTYILLFTAVWVAFYFQRPSDTVNTFAMTVMVSMLYVQMHNYSDSVLWDRVTETAAGGVVAILVSLLVFRVPTRNLARAAARDYFTEFDTFVNQALATLTDEESSSTLRAAARRLQQSLWQFGQTVASPVPFGPASSGELTTEHLSVLTALTHDVAKLAKDADASGPFAEAQRHYLTVVGSRISAALPVTGDWLAGKGDPPSIIRSPELDDLDLALRLDGTANATAHLMVLGDLMDIEEHLVDLLNIDHALSPDDAAPQQLRRLPPAPTELVGS